MASSRMRRNRGPRFVSALAAAVLAFPPGALLDPVAAGLADSHARTTAADPGRAERVAAELAGGWAKLREDAGALMTAGIAVVAPAGDLGPDPQSVLGVAG